LAYEIFFVISGLYLFIHKEIKLTGYSHYGHGMGTMLVCWLVRVKCWF